MIDKKRFLKYIRMVNKLGRFASLFVYTDKGHFFGITEGTFYITHNSEGSFWGIKGVLKFINNVFKEEGYFIQALIKIDGLVVSVRELLSIKTPEELDKFITSLLNDEISKKLINSI